MSPENFELLYEDASPEVFEQYLKNQQILMEETHGRVQRTIKRMLDIGISALLLPLSAPLFLLTALAIKLNSPGPVFFLQERAGLSNRKFVMIKFRSMVPDAEHHLQHIRHLNEADGPIFKIGNDPRITSVGSFLRRYSIDELPQLLNVLRGDMSLVGPRPHLTDEAARYSRSTRRRLSMKPGMTGLAQVSGRSKLSWNDAVALDLDYIDKWDNLIDIRIMARTFHAVFATTGAT